LVELGPGGGEAGGRIIAQGNPRALSKNRASVTGPWLEFAGREPARTEVLDAS
jgi:excinuclease ABC subunit A